MRYCTAQSLTPAVVPEELFQARDKYDLRREYSTSMSCTVKKKKKRGCGKCSALVFAEVRSGMCFHCSLRTSVRVTVAWLATGSNVFDFSDPRSVGPQ